MKPIVELTDINFTYGPHSVLEQVNFSVEPGDYLGIIGPNGSGKTTLLKLLLGLLKPASGQISLFNDAPDALKERYLIGYVPQRLSQADYQFPATVKEIVRSGRTTRLGLWQNWQKSDEAVITRAMNVTHIKHLADRLFGQLSGGERQRVLIARALAAEPKLLILDEPTVGVDTQAQEQFYSLLCELNTKHKLTIILVSHDIDVVAQEVKTVLFLNRTVIAHGKPRELMKEKYLEKLYSGMKLIVHHH